jgi:glycosyltransferase involved in cell wall biosynthesis
LPHDTQPRCSYSSPVRGLMVSFVVIAYNEDHQIRACLSSITAQSDLGLCEIIVVNDGSTDRTAERVTDFAREFPCVRLVNQRNSGRGSARAVGVALARGDFVAMVDGDITLPPDWLRRCRRELAGQHCDAVGGVAVPDGDASFICDAFRLTPRARSGTTTVTGNNGLYTRALIDHVKFDSNLRTAEDIAFNYALVSAGFSARCLEDVVVFHKEDKGYVRALLWAFESGISASGQLRYFKKLRTPDLTYFGALAVPAIGFAIGELLPGVGGLLAAASLTLAYLLAVGGAHLAGKTLLKVKPTYLARFALASVANSTLTTSYLLGRTVGLFKKVQFRTITLSSKPAGSQPSLAAPADIGERGVDQRSTSHDHHERVRYQSVPKRRRASRI